MQKPLLICCHPSSTIEPPHYKSPTALLDMHHLTCGISSLLHSVNLILFTVLLVHLILCISPHYSHHLCCHHLSLPRPFSPDLKLISFTNPFLYSHSYSCRTAFTDREPWCLFVLVFFLLRVLDKTDHSGFMSTLNSSFVSPDYSLVLLLFTRAMLC